MFIYKLVDPTVAEVVGYLEREIKTNRRPFLLRKDWLDEDNVEDELTDKTKCPVASEQRREVVN